MASGVRTEIGMAMREEVVRYIVHEALPALLASTASARTDPTTARMPAKSGRVDHVRSAKFHRAEVAKDSLRHALGFPARDGRDCHCGPQLRDGIVATRRGGHRENLECVGELGRRVSAICSCQVIDSNEVLTRSKICTSRGVNDERLQRGVADCGGVTFQPAHSRCTLACPKDTESSCEYGRTLDISSGEEV